MAEEDAVLSKFEAIVNHFGEAVSQMKVVAEGKFSEVEAKVDSAGGIGKGTWKAVEKWLPTAENRAGESTGIHGPFAPSGTPDFMRDKAVGTERWKMLGSGIQNMGAGAFGGFSKGEDGKLTMNSAAQSGKDIMGGIGNIMGAIGGPVGQVGMLFAKLSEKLIGAIDFMQQYSEALHNQNMQFAEFSASMSAVQAQQEIRDIQLSQERGERRAEAAGYLAEGKSELASKTAPWGDALSNIQSYIGGSINRLLSGVLTPINYIAEKVGLIEGKDDKTKSEETFLSTYFQDEYQKKYGRPLRFRE